MKKNTLGYFFELENPTLQVRGNGAIVMPNTTPEVNEDGGLLVGCVFAELMPRKKARRAIRLIRRYKQFIKKNCLKCVSYKKDDYCEDLEMKVWDFNYHTCKCNWLVKKEKDNG